MHKVFCISFPFYNNDQHSLNIFVDEELWEAHCSSATAGSRGTHCSGLDDTTLTRPRGIYIHFEGACGFSSSFYSRNSLFWRVDFTSNIPGQEALNNIYRYCTRNKGAQDTTHCVQTVSHTFTCQQCSNYKIYLNAVLKLDLFMLLLSAFWLICLLGCVQVEWMQMSFLSAVGEWAAVGWPDCRLLCGKERLFKLPIHHCHCSTEQGDSAHICSYCMYMYTHRLALPLLTLQTQSHLQTCKHTDQLYKPNTLACVYLHTCRKVKYGNRDTGETFLKRCRCQINELKTHKNMHIWLTAEPSAAGKSFSSSLFTCAWHSLPLPSSSNKLGLNCR